MNEDPNTPHPPSRNPIHILMAEDDPEDRMLVEDAWEECHILNPLQMVEDGIELIDYLKNQGKYTDKAKYPKPGLILLDLNMPRMDGRQALHEIKSNPSLCGIPIVILTTSKAEEDILRSYKMGANSFITKPVTFDSLIEIVKTLSKYWLEIVHLNPNA